MSVPVHILKRGCRLSWSLIARTYSPSPNPSLNICFLCLTEELMLMQQPALGTLYVEDEFMFFSFFAIYRIERQPFSFTLLAKLSNSVSTTLQILMQKNKQNVIAR